MSTLTIDANAKPIQVLRPDTATTVSVSTSSATSSSALTGARVARIVSDVDVHYAVGSTATTTSTYLPANTVEFIHVYTGDTISIIGNSSSGIAYITEMV